MKSPRILSLLGLFTFGMSFTVGAEPSSGTPQLARGIVNSKWTWSTKANDPAPKTTVTVHGDGTVTWSDRPTLHSPYTVIDEYTIHQNQSIWRFSPDLQSLKVESDPVPIRFGKRLN